MKKHNELNRRAFMKLLASSSAYGALGSMGQLALMSEASAAAPDFSNSGYKAMVCVFLPGGNDSFNMLIPSDAGYGVYQASRGDLAIANMDLDLSSISADIHNGALANGAGNPYNVNQKQDSAYLKGFYDLSGSNGINLGVNAVMPEFAQLMTDNKASIIANVGNLVESVTRQAIDNNSANLPLFLFAHNHQQRALQTGQADNLNDIGWAGKIADAWLGINNNFPLGLNISYGGNSRMLIGDNTGPLVLGTGTPEVFTEMRPNINSEIARRTVTKALSSGVHFTDSNPFKRLYGNMLDASMTTFETLSDVWSNPPYTSTGPYGEALFAVPSASDLGFTEKLTGSLIPKLESVARMIDLGAQDAFNTGDYKRQIFFVTLGGFDNHSSQAVRHPLLLRELSLGLWKFQKALEERGHAEKVTTFSMSDFGRTLRTNSGGGTDHAWGAHHFVMGGAGNNTAGNLNGGIMTGTLPDLTLNGPDDYNFQGRIIPTLSQDQLNASICQWFGVDESLISSIFPNLSNFQTTPGNVSSAFLNDLFVS